MEYLKCKLCKYKLKKKIKMIKDEEHCEEYQLDRLRDHYELEHSEYNLPIIED